MVRETSYSQAFSRCKVEDFFNILYADPAAAKAYHKEADKDDNTQVEAWKGNSRTVHFTMPMSIPGVIAKIIRTDKIPVKEVQQVERDAEGNLHVVSTPHIGVPGGSKFVAVAKLKVSNTTNGCLVQARVVCTAQGPFGLTGMIEGIMADQSATSIKTYIAFCSRHCQARLGEMADTSSPRSDSTTFEQFYDAQEALSRSASFSSIVSEAGQPAMSDLDHPAGLNTQGFIDTVAAMKILDALDGRAQLLISDLQAVRALLQPDQHPQKPQRSWKRIWLSGFSIGAAFTACVFLVLRRNTFRTASISLSPNRS